MWNVTFIKKGSITTAFFKLSYKIISVITSQGVSAFPFLLHGNVYNDVLHFHGFLSWCSFCCLYSSNSSESCSAESFLFPASAWGFCSTVCYSSDFTCSFRLLYLRLMRHSFSAKKLFRSTLSCIDKLITTIKCLYMFRNDCWLPPEAHCL